MFKVNLFGTGRAEYGGVPLEGFPAQQPYLLLCYLLLNKEIPHHREHLAAVLWGDHPTQLAKKYFRNTLWRLRGLLTAAGMPADEYLIVQDERIAFNSRQPFWLDVEILQKTTARHAHISPAELNAEQAAELIETAKLLCGELLEGIYEDWAIFERERLRLMGLNLLSQLVEYYGFRGDFECGLEYCKRILGYENTREDIHRQMMWMYWQAGNQASALNQYKLCCQILRDEMGVTPTEATRRLYEEMLHHPGRTLDLSSHQEFESSTKPEDNSGITAMLASVIDKLLTLETMMSTTNSDIQQIKSFFQIISNGKQKH